MSKVYLFAVMLLAASLTGCIEGGDLEKSTTTDEEEVEETEEEDTLDPVGADDNSGKPGVEFVGLFEIWTPFLIVAIYDTDGYVRSYSIESSNEGSLTGDEEGCTIPFTASNSDSAYDCYALADSILIEVCGTLEHVDQTITVKIEDNDGNKASAEYDIVFDDLECDGGQGESSPIATFFVQEDSSGVYHVDVIKVSKQEDLAGFSFYLKDTSGSTYVGGTNGFGEVAMQVVGGEEHGIERSYSGDDEQLQNRADNITDDDGSDYPVHFNDNDSDGKLSAGDQFMVHGTGTASSGPADDGWRLDIQFDASGDIIGSAKML